MRFNMNWTESAHIRDYWEAPVNAAFKPPDSAIVKSNRRDKYNRFLKKSRL